MPRPAQLLGLLLISATAACARPGSFGSSGPFDIDQAPSDGLRYYVTRDLISIDAKTSTHHTAVHILGGECTPRDSVATTWTVSVTTAPDRRQAYRLGLTPGGSVEQTFGVKVSETGVLQGVNYASTDQRAAIFTTVARGVAGILGSVVRGGLTASKDTSCAQASKLRALLDSTTHVLRTFDVTELPPSPGGDLTAAEVARALAAHPRESELVSLAHVFVSVSPLPDPATPLESPGVAHASPAGCGGRDSTCSRIYYREPIMRVIRVYVPNEVDARRATYTIREEHVVPLVAAGDPILFLAFGAQSLGAGKLALTFGPHGNVTGVEQTSSAALAGAATAAATAAESARDAYMAALKAQVDRLDLELKAARDDAAIRKAQAADSAAPR